MNVKSLAKEATIRAVQQEPVRSARTARATMDRLSLCRKLCSSDVAILMIIAANQGLLGENQLSAESYQRALQYDRRPELYLNLGLVMLDMHQREEARQVLTKAVAFAPEMAEEISDPQLKAEVQKAAAARDARIRGQ